MNRRSSKYIVYTQNVINGHENVFEFWLFWIEDFCEDDDKTANEFLHFDIILLAYGFQIPNGCLSLVTCRPSFSSLLTFQTIWIETRNNLFFFLLSFFILEIYPVDENG